ncbi:MAG TPA: hypothetical protein VFE02_18755 [Candidatus Acidoferrales bacterium]|jgi:hypothetical protein|nr:hypothetical protein [Candidatus Acidoferrales bacterium]
MRKLTRWLVVLSFVAASAGVAAAQGMPAAGGTIPKVLQITREFVKPGKAGASHDKSESAFVDAMARAKWPTHYLAMTSLSGKSRALYLTQYDSFDAWEKDYEAGMKNSALTAVLDRASVADGQLLDAVDQGVFYYHEEMSLRPRADISQMRLMEVDEYHVRPGKRSQWEAVVKMVKDGYEKGVPDAHWAMFELIYGGDEGTYLVLTSHRSMSEIDAGFAQDKQFAASMGEDGMKKLDEMYGECCEVAQAQLFAFNAAQSYPPDEWVKAAPEFWKHKPMAPVAAKPPADNKPTKP